MANADILRVLPDWFKGAVQSNLPNNDHDRAGEPESKCLLGSFRDFKQITEVKTAKESIIFTPPQPVVVRAADELTTKNAQNQTINNGNKARLLGSRITGFHGVCVKVTKINEQAIKFWKNQPLKRSNYGQIALCNGNKVVCSAQLKYDAQFVMSDSVNLLLDQFTESLNVLKRTGGNLDDYCLDRIMITLEPSVEVAIGFIPVYEMWSVDIDHDKDSSLATTLGAVAIVGGIIIATILTAGLIEIIAAGGLTALVAGGEAAIGGSAVAGLLIGETAAASTIVEMAVIGSRAVPVGLRVGASVLGATF